MWRGRRSRLWPRSPSTSSSSSPSFSSHSSLFVSEVVPPDVTAIGVLVSLAVLAPFTGSRRGTPSAGSPVPQSSPSWRCTSSAPVSRETGIVERLGSILADVTGGDEGLLTGATVATTGIGAGFVNNTPIVAVFIPLVTGLSERYGISPSKLLMPLSFAAMLGGTLTLVGTSTNLLASEYARSCSANRWGCSPSLTSVCWCSSSVSSISSPSVDGSCRPESPRGGLHPGVRHGPAPLTAGRSRGLGARGPDRERGARRGPGRPGRGAASCTQRWRKRQRPAPSSTTSTSTSSRSTGTGSPSSRRPRTSRSSPTTCSPFGEPQAVNRFAEAFRLRHHQGDGHRGRPLGRSRRRVPRRGRDST